MKTFELLMEHTDAHLDGDVEQEVEHAMRALAALSVHAAQVVGDDVIRCAVGEYLSALSLVSAAPFSARELGMMGELADNLRCPGWEMDDQIAEDTGHE